MINGEYHEGLLLEKNDQFIILKNSNGTFKLLAENIKKVDEHPYDGIFEYRNNHDTRYFIAPSAIPLKKGKGIYSNFFLTTNAVNYGISNNFSIGMATEAVNTFAFFDPIWSINAKAGFWISDKVHLGGGISWTNQTFLRKGYFSRKKNELIALIPYSVITFGHSESNFSLGLSYNAFESFDFFDGRDINGSNLTDQRGPILSISASRRLTPKISVMSENNFGYLDNRLKYVGIQGMNLHYKKNNCKLGLLYILPYNDSFVIIIPFLGYAIMF